MSWIFLSLEREIDNLPIDARFRERKIHDMTLRLDALYDTIVELEERIEDAKPVSYTHLFGLKNKYGCYFADAVD